MRAHALWQALAASTEVTVAVVPVAEIGGGAATVHELQQAPLESFSRIALPTPTAAATSWLSTAAARQLLGASGTLPRRARLAAPVCTEALAAGPSFDLVYVLRLYLAGTALPFLATGQATHIVLDIDEDDAAVARQLALLSREADETSAAQSMEQEAEALEHFAAAAHKLFERVACASDIETDALEARGVNALTLPNVVAIGPQPATAARPAEPRLLFLGNLEYPPNRDAALRLIQQVLPAVRTAIPRARLLLAGAGTAALQQQFGDTEGIDWLGYVEDLPALYRRASIVVVPLRAGGGSRLKILEAFERGTPVVATRKAVQGLAVVAGQHALLAESDAALAAAVVRLHDDAELSASLACAARQLVVDNYSPEILLQRVRGIVESLLGPVSGFG